MTNTPKKRGAPHGNHNALKHGLYARALPATDLINLDEAPQVNLVPEIELLRILIARAVQVAQTAQTIPEINACLRSISFAAANLNRLMRTQNMLNIVIEKDEYDAAMNQAMAELLVELKAEGKKKDELASLARTNPIPGGTPVEWCKKVDTKNVLIR